MDNPTTPGSSAPTPRFPSGPSPAPRTTGVPRGSRASSAISSSNGSASVVARTGGSCSRRTPATSKASSFQSPVARSSSPVPEALEISVTNSPVNCNRMKSFNPTHQAARPAVSESCSANHISLVRCDIEWIGVPDVRCRRRPSSVSRSRIACAAARESAQVSNGVIGRCPASRPIRPCIAVETPIPKDSPREQPARIGQAGPYGSPHNLRILHLQPGRGCCSGYSWTALVRQPPPRAKAETLAAVVPTSRPITTRAPWARRSPQRPNCPASARMPPWSRDR